MYTRFMVVWPSSSFLIMLSEAAVVGLTDTHLCDDAVAAVLGARVHVDAAADLERLREAAARDGFALTLTSGFRSFERQRSIWNRKVDGQLAVLDSTGTPLDVTTLSPTALMYAIMRWSALPGASRHHWGTDIDVYDAATTPEGYEVQLIPAEVDPGGMHGAMHQWLDARIADGTSFGFYRPYDRDRGGVAPERWHLSYAPVSAQCEAVLTLDVLRDTIAAGDLRLADVILEQLPALYVRFVRNVAHPPAHFA
jgi:LAS superfamily LD-carboxypeptidase LdcB